jgi:hypothetical protein
MGSASSCVIKIVKLDRVLMIFTSTQMDGYRIRDQQKDRILNKLMYSYRAAAREANEIGPNVTWSDWLAPTAAVRKTKC